MKYISYIIMSLSLLFSANLTKAQDIGELLGGLLNSNKSSQSSNGKNNAGGIIGNLLEGVFSSSDLTVNDIMGEWTSNGPAVCFQSDNFLKKAGGVAAASMIESKLAPYYQQYGLDGATVTINRDATFSIKLKRLTLKGTVAQVQGEKGVFEFTFTALGAVKLGSFKAYVQKSFNTMSLMFDATKLKTLASAVTRISGIKLAQTVVGLLDSYEGLCVGFRMERTDDAPSGSSDSISNPNDSTEDGVGSIIGDLLNGALNGGNQNQNGNSTNTKSNNRNTVKPQTQNKTQTQNKNNNNQGSGIDKLRNILNNRGK